MSGTCDSDAIISDSDEQEVVDLQQPASQDEDDAMCFAICSSSPVPEGTIIEMMSCKIERTTTQLATISTVVREQRVLVVVLVVLVFYALITVSHVRV